MDTLYLNTQVVRLICDTPEKQTILHACHSDLTSGHLGIKRTLRESENGSHGKGVTKKLLNCMVSIRRSICTIMYAVYTLRDYSWNIILFVY